MKIANDLAVAIHYTLTDESGETIDSSAGAEPLTYLQGHANIIPGLERELEGCAVGDKKVVTVQPADGYGEHDENLVQAVPREMFSGVDSIEVGMEFQVQGPQGEQFVEVTEVSEETITVDGNHVLAGKVLNFDVEVVDVREATQEELEHGHIHGEGCSH
ncbi:peptidylprolyl isomerase [Marinagarivorans cellulosilyticus]|uniref:Peptidyl-prolyl cis-trans isomerase n=1 Tax=Marinagarivorans cellulosilyticus TaxID=2721545 RepID=A0AAN2BL11_9GAMM|nr:peptidylprolyl isomerase [Marinagarivorans cellulosilyticus]BCD98599.1 FKBP-type peptidyl-prolyl cis-trans isomerase SlyD [Marinagarivorans cellulosilyticus]